MSDKVFIDTNILIYAFSEDEPQKQQIALSLIESVTYDATISNQVINELANVFLKKFKLSTSAVERTGCFALRRPRRAAAAGN